MGAEGVAMVFGWLQNADAMQATTNVAIRGAGRPIIPISSLDTGGAKKARLGYCLVAHPADRER